MATATETAATAADDGGTVAWADASNALASGGGVASVALEADEDADLRISDFGFAIPADATITGVVVNIRRRKTGTGDSEESAINIVHGAVGLGSKDSSVWPASIEDETFGGSSDLWDATITPTIANDVTFAVVVSSTSFSGDVTLEVDFVSVTIYYLVAGGASKVASVGIANKMSIGL